MLKPIYLHVADKIIRWHDLNPGNVGAVVGATAIPELEHIAQKFVMSGKQIPLLIPGVGKQGGSAKEVMAALRKVGYNLDIVRINSSSELNFAWEKEDKKEDYAGAAARALKRLNEEIGYT
jgi:orotidine-5'-phosphate decarboxylase